MREGESTKRVLSSTLWGLGEQQVWAAVGQRLRPLFVALLALGPPGMERLRGRAHAAVSAGRQVTLLASSNRQTPSKFENDIK